MACIPDVPANLQAGVAVDVVGYMRSKPLPAVADSPNITFHNIPDL